MISTPALIDSLAANMTPIRRLRPPFLRAGLWLALAACILILFAAAHGLRANLMERLQEPIFAVGIAASLVTGILAALASFMISLPDRSRLWLALPLPALMVWISTIGYGCLTNWVEIGPRGVVQCFATLVLTSLPLSLALLVMLRYAAATRPLAVTMIGSLAVAGVTSTALSLFHELDATVMILMWNLGAPILIVGLAGAFGRRAFSWMAPRSIALHR